MWPFKKKDSQDIPLAAAAAIIISAVSLAASLGTARWSWLLLDEQIKLRKEFMEVKNDQEQTTQQYEFWLKRLQDERVKYMKDQAAPAPEAMPKK
jgi:hypothetical protein